MADISPAQQAANALIYSGGEAAESDLTHLFDSFGGVEAFTKPKLESGMKELRNLLLGSENFPVNLYNDVVNGTAKFSRNDLYQVGINPVVFESYPLFKRFWDISADEMVQCFHRFATHAAVHSPKWAAGKFWEDLPVIHASTCSGDNDPNRGHYTCTRRRIFHPDNFLNTVLSIRDDIEQTVDPLVIETIHDAVLDCSAHSREVYARGYHVKETHWALLARDSKRDVLNAIVGNPLLPSDVATDIVLTHKTPHLREEIAAHTVDTGLLAVIWNSTKSASIRGVVEGNPFFVKPAEG